MLKPTSNLILPMMELIFTSKDTHRVGYQPDRLMPNAMHYVVASEPHVLRDGVAGACAQFSSNFFRPILLG